MAKVKRGVVAPPPADAAGLGLDPHAAPMLANKAERVRYIMGLMRELQWVTGGTGPVLAKRWGLALNTVEVYAAEASRRVCEEIGEPSFARASITASMQRLMRDNLASRDPRAASAVVQAGRLWADLAGVAEQSRVPVAPSRIVVEETDADGAPHAADDEHVAAEH